MIDHVSISNFKSIKSLEFSCKRINIFIGRPNTGKSNLLESLDIFSLPNGNSTQTLKQLVRLENGSNIFFDDDISNEIRVEEPEAKAFPYYIKHLSERIALDTKNNQSFLTTHNPYFLLSLLEKTPKDELAVFISSFKEGETRLSQLKEEAIPKIMGYSSDVFFNLDKLTEV